MPAQTNISKRPSHAKIMRIDDLIDKLVEIELRHGDIQVMIHSDDCGNLPALDAIYFIDEEGRTCCRITA